MNNFTSIILLIVIEIEEMWNEIGDTLQVARRAMWNK